MPGRKGIHRSIVAAFAKAFRLPLAAGFLQNLVNRTMRGIIRYFFRGFLPRYENDKGHYRSQKGNEQQVFGSRFHRTPPQASITAQPMAPLCWGLSGTVTR